MSHHPTTYHNQGHPKRHHGEHRNHAIEKRTSGANAPFDGNGDEGGDDNRSKDHKGYLDSSHALRSGNGPCLTHSSQGMQSHAPMMKREAGRPQAMQTG
jgi:hypothetical protein